MKTKVNTVLIVLIMFAFVYMSIAGLSQDGWYRDLYCFGRVDALDPWCP